MGVPERQFEVLESVHKFHLELLTSTLGHPVPVPDTVSRLLNLPKSQAEIDALDGFRQWLDLLDLAISPLMIRDTLKANGSWAVAEALLCYYAWKRTGNDSDRDKADFVVTYLYRNPRVPDQWTPSVGRSDEQRNATPPFEIAIRKILGPEGHPALSREHEQIADEFDFFRQDVEDFRDFDQIIDSGLMTRVRDAKEKLGQSFYHPHVLAKIGAYNAFFGPKFDQLFHAAAKTIKSFAAKVQEEGGSLMSRVDGDVIVKQLADLQEAKIFQAEYQRAQEEFHRVSLYKKAVDRRRGRAADAPAQKRSDASQRARTTTDSPAPSLQGSVNVEEARIQATEEGIALFIRAADRKTPVTAVPLRHGNLSLFPAEVEAYRTDYAQEKSFRADCARFHVRTVGLIARMTDELTEYRNKQSSSYLWKPHGDSLAYLLKAAEVTSQTANDLRTIAQQRGLKEKSSAIESSLQRLQEQMQVVSKALQSLGAAGM